MPPTTYIRFDASPFVRQERPGVKAFYLQSQTRTNKAHGTWGTVGMTATNPVKRHISGADITVRGPNTYSFKRPRPIGRLVREMVRRTPIGGSVPRVVESQGDDNGYDYWSNTFNNNDGMQRAQVENEDRPAARRAPLNMSTDTGKEQKNLPVTTYYSGASEVQSTGTPGGGEMTPMSGGYMSTSGTAEYGGPPSSIASSVRPSPMPASSNRPSPIDTSMHTASPMLSPAVSSSDITMHTASPMEETQMQMPLQVQENTGAPTTQIVPTEVQPEPVDQMAAFLSANMATPAPTVNVYGFTVFIDENQPGQFNILQSVFNRIANSVREMREQNMPLGSQLQFIGLRYPSWSPERVLRVIRAVNSVNQTVTLPVDPTPGPSRKRKGSTAQAASTKKVKFQEPTTPPVESAPGPSRKRKGSTAQAASTKKVRIQEPARAKPARQRANSDTSAQVVKKQSAAARRRHSTSSAAPNAPVIGLGQTSATPTLAGQASVSTAQPMAKGKGRSLSLKSVTSQQSLEQLKSAPASASSSASSINQPPARSTRAKRKARTEAKKPVAKRLRSATKKK